MVSLIEEGLMRLRSKHSHNSDYNLYKLGKAVIYLQNQGNSFIVKLIILLESHNTLIQMKEQNSQKQHAKLLKYQKKAELCLTRKEAQKLIKKSDKTHNKLTA